MAPIHIAVVRTEHIRWILASFTSLSAAVNVLYLLTLTMPLSHERPTNRTPYDDDINALNGAALEDKTPNAQNGECESLREPKIGWIAVA